MMATHSPRPPPAGDQVLGFISRKDGKICSLCGEEMPAGVIIIPDPRNRRALPAGGVGGENCWVHLACTSGLSLESKAEPGSDEDEEGEGGEEGEEGGGGGGGGVGGAAGTPTAGKARRVPVCKHWKRKGFCAFEAKCYFRHPPKQKGADKKARAEKRGWGGRLVLRNENRCAMLRRFLVETYGREYLASGSGVLDVAGGKGELAFELLNVDGIPATVIDPRPLDLKCFKRRLQRGMYHRNLALNPAGMTDSSRRAAIVSGGGGGGGGDGEGAGIAREEKEGKGGPAAAVAGTTGKRSSCAPDHCRVMLDNCLLRWAAQPKSENDAAFVASQLERARRVMWTPNGMNHEGHEGEGHEGDGDESDEGDEGDGEGEGEVGCDCSVQRIDEASTTVTAIATATATPATATATASAAAAAAATAAAAAGIHEVTDPEDIRNLLMTCSVVVGMHPDQATDPIMDLAMRTGKPFACVPCCVYSKQFHKRRLKVAWKGVPKEAAVGGGAEGAEGAEGVEDAEEDEDDDEDDEEEVPEGQQPTKVTTYDQLLQYLVEQSGGKVKELAFEGRNKVVYTTPLRPGDRGGEGGKG